MRFTSLEIPDVLLIEPKIFEDERGIVFESYRENLIEEKIGRKISFVQENICVSKKGFVRGLHYQTFPMEQDKLVRVTRGEVFDVVVDLRENLPTFGQYITQVLSSKNRKQLFIPFGFAHGFLTLSDEAEFSYKLSNYYSPENQHCLLWSDPQLAIPWPYDFKRIKASIRDQQGHFFDHTNLEASKID